MSVRRQGFWNQWQLKLRESLPHLVDFIMRHVVCDASVVFQASFIPKRFKQSWAKKAYSEGAQIEDILSQERNRNTYLRRLAIKQYGLKCYACDFVPKTSNQIDIHHLDPIAEGERQTTLDDLIPLCANCHRLAHSEQPPLTIEMLKALLQQAFLGCTIRKIY
jgi:5-methylcytosine-specific restriction protein A